jgi:hypothetical protein
MHKHVLYTSVIQYSYVLISKYHKITICLPVVFIISNRGSITLGKNMRTEYR